MGLVPEGYFPCPGPLSLSKMRVKLWVTKWNPINRLSAPRLSSDPETPPMQRNLGTERDELLSIFVLSRGGGADGLTQRTRDSVTPTRSSCPLSNSQELIIKQKTIWRKNKRENGKDPCLLWSPVPTFVLFLWKNVKIIPMTSAGSEQSPAPGPLRKHLLRASMGPPGLRVRGCARHGYGCGALTALGEFEYTGGVKAWAKASGVAGRTVSEPWNKPRQGWGAGDAEKHSEATTTLRPCWAPSPRSWSPPDQYGLRGEKGPSQQLLIVVAVVVVVVIAAIIISCSNEYFLYPQYFLYIIWFHLQNNPIKYYTIINLLLQMRKLRLRKVLLLIHSIFLSVYHEPNGTLAVAMRQNPWLCIVHRFRWETHLPGALSLLKHWNQDSNAATLTKTCTFNLPKHKLPGPSHWHLQSSLTLKCQISSILRYIGFHILMS